MPETDIVVSALSVTSDGRRAVTSLVVGTALVWDLTTAKPSAALAPKATAAYLAQWWVDLASSDGAKAYAARWRLSEAPPDSVVALIRKNLKPAAALDPAIV